MQLAGLKNHELRQYGMEGWEKRYEYFITCGKCNITFLSNAKGEVLYNCKTYTSCPYCEEVKP